MRKVLYLLGQLSDADLEWLVAVGRKRDIPAGTVLIQEGARLETLYILLKGQLEVTASYMKSTRVRLGSGEIVGEISLLDSRPPIATVTATEPSVVLALPREQMLEKLASDDSFAAHIYRAMAVLMAQRLRTTGQALADGDSIALSDDMEYEGELSVEVLDDVHMAGARFERVLQRLLAK